MRQLSGWRKRGAARHWLMGCGAAILVLLVGLSIAGYFFAERVGEILSATTFDASAKADPPVTAPPDEVLPPVVAGYTRQEVTVLPAGNPRPDQADAPTSVGLMTTTYRRGNDTVTVTAVPTVQAQAIKGRRGSSGDGEQEADPEAGEGVQVRHSLGNTFVYTATWSNRNWMYTVETSGLPAIDFAKEFNPVPPASPASSGSLSRP